MDTLGTLKNNKFSQDSGMDIRTIFYLIVKYWYLFFISILLGVLFAKIHLRYAEPIYSVQATLLVKDEKKQHGADGFIEGMELLSISKNIQNEIEIIRSYNNVKKALQELGFDISYFAKGNIKTGELYKSSPFDLKIDTNFAFPKNTPFYIDVLSDSTFSIYSEHYENSDSPKDENSSKNSRSIFKFGNVSKFGPYNFILNKSDGFKDVYKSSNQYYFVINDIDQVTQAYLSRLKIEQAHKSSSILLLSLQGLIPKKEIDFLNKLCQVYIESGLEEKNQITVNTIRFIDSQLDQIIDSLQGAENKLEKFRLHEKLMNISSAADKAYNQLESLEKERAEMLVKDKFYNYLLDYVNYNYDIKKLISPSAMGISDPLLNKLIDELHSLNSEKASLEFSTKEKNPSYNIVELKIENTKKALVENLKNIIQGSKMSLEDNQQRLNKLQSLINRLPSNERNLVNIQRKFTLNDNIYNYLMEKRIEAGIAKAANLPDNKVINNAMLFGANPISPKSSRIYLIALVVGLIIPGAFVFIKFYFNNTIFNKEVIESNTSAPVIGSIAHYTGKGTIPIVESPKSVVSESIRSLRVNLQYLAVGKKNKILGITSSVSGEGKTFFSTNLAASIALSGAKVILVGADLRKPRLQYVFDTDNSAGLSTYYIGKSPIEQIIKKTNIANLDLITSGPIPPNPTELLESGKSSELINFLSLHYEYIIIDAPPIGMVADYYLLAKNVDAHLYLVRQNYTKKELLKDIQETYDSKKLNNLFIVFNDVKNRPEYGAMYYYGYNNYGYYHDDEQPSRPLFKKLFRRLIG